MPDMNAAVVTSFDEPPHYLPFARPVGDAVVDVVAVGLHPRVRSGASGRHYTSTGTLPMVPGVDGVGRRADGTLVYFVADDDVIGTMAELSVADPHRSIALPADADAVQVAAAMNPAMSSWVALRRRVPIEPGQSVFVLGVTGNAGAMAARVARLLGAGRVVGAGRDQTRLDELVTCGVLDEAAVLTGDTDASDRAVAGVAAEADIVLDYLWGEPAAQAMLALVTARSDRSRALDWIQIGSVAGPTTELASVALRSANLRVQGIGQGSVSPRDYLAELPSLVEQIAAGALAVETLVVPLSEVEQAWSADPAGRRVVIVPDPARS